MPPPPPPPPPQQQQQQPNVEVMELTAASTAAQQQHQHMLLDLQAQRMASSMDVPTLPDQVRDALRQLNCPVRLFGENPANVRDRLRLELAKRRVYGEHYHQYGGDHLHEDMDGAVPDAAPSSALAEAVQETQYSRAGPALVKAREKIATHSLQRAQARLEQEAKLRASYRALTKKRKQMGKIDENDENVDTSNHHSVEAMAQELDVSCCQMYQSFQNASLAGSQYGDTRPLSAIATTNNHNTSLHSSTPCALTASWSATLQWWDASTPMLTAWGKRTQAHEDRIMGVALQYYRNNNSTHQLQQQLMAGTASIDLTAKLWAIQEQTQDQSMEEVGSSHVKKEGTTSKKDNDDDDDESMKYGFTQLAHLKGHEARLCKIAFHPLGDWVATTSHDHTWRLWDIETATTTATNQNDSNNNNNQSSPSSSELLLQDGHADKVFGIDFHPDGSLCATTDYSGMIHVWDLRTGKSVLQYYGHAGRVLCAKFAPTNGFQMTTAGDDGCLKVWDIRHRRKTQKGAPEPRRTIPAHSKLITQLEYTPDDECLISSSFDGSAKVWSTRGDWKLLQTLEGHEGKVMGVGVVATYEEKTSTPSDWGVVTCGFDHTLKLWR